MHATTKPTSVNKTRYGRATYNVVLPIMFISQRKLRQSKVPIHRLISVDNHEPSSSERKQNDDRLRDLMQNPKTRLAAKKNREADEKQFGDLLRVIPDIFLYEDQGNHGGLEKLAFHPNPAFAPKTYEETALHAMSGVVS